MMEKSVDGRWGNPVFFKRLTLLSAGQGIAQLLPALCTPLTARLYTPQAFGELALYLSAANIVTQLSACKYDYAVTVSESREEGIRLTKLAMLLTVIFSVILLLLLPVYPMLMRWLGGVLWLYFLPLGVLLTMLELILVNLGISRGEFARVSAAAVFRAAVFCLLQVVFYPLGVTGLIISRFGGDIAGISLLWRSELLQKTKMKQLSKVAAKYRAYPRYMLPGAAASALSGNIQSFFLSAFYTSAQTGCYALVNRLLGAPVTVLSAAAGQVFLRQSVEEVQSCGRVTSAGKVTVLLGAAAGVLFGGICLLAPWLVPLLLGQGWTDAVPFLRIQCLLYAVRFVTVPVTLVVPALGRQRNVMLWQFAMLGLCLLVPLVHLLSALTAEEYLMLTAVVLSAGYLVFLWYCLRLCAERQVLTHEQ